MKQILDGVWTMYPAADTEDKIPTTVPGSVYSALLGSKRISNPYFRENEYISTSVSEDDYVFARTFEPTVDMMGCDKVLLKFYGIDTIADIFLNNTLLGKADNMHREWVYDVTDIIKGDENLLEVKFTSPLKYIAEKDAAEPLWGVNSTVKGFPHIRKAHYMFGWDWGPKLPDMGIWRSCELIGVKGGLIDSLYIKQDHSRVAEGIVDITAQIHLTHCDEREKKLVLTVPQPSGKTIVASKVIAPGQGNVNISFEISDAKLWYPRGYGKQPLYTVQTELIDTESGEVVSERTEKIGLRTVAVSREKDDMGEEFAFVVNGIKIFAMGANYVPEDQILSRISREKTAKLLKQCAMANYNMIRVWGGGFYPADYFYEICDELGLLVWQDLMFACAVYRADKGFCENVRHEIEENAKRFRNHPSLAMWCGNNEIESALQYWGIPRADSYKKDYLRLFEELAPKVLSHYDPQTFYWPSSPSSGGGFSDLDAENKGDSHYWQVWHSLAPFTEYNKHSFRFCSEYGFESVPSMKTVISVADYDDLNLMSPVMEAHQKCEQGNEKLMYYLAQMVHYPYDFEGLVYASQLVQADAIRLNVERMRRMRGVCMGSLYWQVNDSNPVISWSSIDYYHRWKALHYYAKRFYAPVLISADMTDYTAVHLNVSSEKQEAFSAKIIWRVRCADGTVFRRGAEEITVNPFCAEDKVVLTLDLTGVDTADTYESRKIRANVYLEYELCRDGRIISQGTSLFVQPKSFAFRDPHIKVNVTEENGCFKIDVSAKAFAKGVMLELSDSDCLFSDNWFDVHAGTVTVYAAKLSGRGPQTAEEFAEKLRVQSYFEAMQLTERE